MSVRVFDPREQKGLQTPASTPSDFEIRWDEAVTVNGVDCNKVNGISALMPFTLYFTEYGAWFL